MLMFLVPFLWLLLWNLKPLSSLQPLDTAITYGPTSFSQQGSNPTIAISAKLARQLNHISDQSGFIITSMRYMSLCGSMLPQNSTSSTFRKFKVTANMIDTSSSTSGAQKFPRAASFKINLSSVRSDTARLKRSFSFCKRFSSFN